MIAIKVKIFLRIRGKIAIWTAGILTFISSLDILRKLFTYITDISGIVIN